METDENPKTEVAFTDARRFARIRLVDCAAEDIRRTTPLKENGPDPVIDREVLTEEWLITKMGSKHVPVKALLLNQANISGKSCSQSISLTKLIDKTQVLATG